MTKPADAAEKQPGRIGEKSPYHALTGFWGGKPHRGS